MKIAPPVRVAEPTVTGCKYDDQLWHLEWLCEELLLLGDGTTNPMLLIPELEDFPDEEVRQLWASAREGVKPLIDTAYELLGEKDDLCR